MAGTPALFTIHNIRYQGLFPREKLPLTGLPRAEFFHPAGLEFWGKISLLSRSLLKRTLLGMISRLDNQKGFDLLVKKLDEILALKVGLIVLGSGDELIQRAIKKAAERHPGRVGFEISFNEPLAHRIMAGADIFLIPSRYEPCGITQMYALKYGTIPEVRATGGLNDTIVQYDPKTGEGNGFKFGPYKLAAMVTAIRKAVNFFQDSSAWKRLMANGMKADFSWNRSAQSYLEIYRSFVEG